MAHVDATQQQGYNKYWPRLTDAGVADTAPLRQDATLTALAQLAALRLGADTATICLIHENKRLLLASAGQHSSLRPRLVDHGASEVPVGPPTPDTTRLIDDYIVRSIWQSISGGEKEDQYHTFIANDVTKDARLADLNALSPGHGIGFYAAAPIGTKPDYPVGILAVCDPRPRASPLNELDLQFLDDTCHIVINHLDQVRSTIDGRQGEGLVRGLATFVEGLSSFKHEISQSKDKVQDFDQRDTPESEGLRATDPQVSPTRGRPNSQPSGSSNVHTTASPCREHESSALQDPDVTVPKHAAESHTSKNRDLDSAVENMRQVFDRAAKSIREATGAQGCVFFDACPSLFAGASSAQPARSASTDSYRFMPDSDLSDDEGGNHDTEHKPHPPRLRRSRSKTDRGQEPAAVLGASVVPSEMHTLQQPLAQRDLRRCLQRYPYGRCFWLADGKAAVKNLSTTDSNVTGGGIGKDGLPMHVAALESQRPFKGLPESLLRNLPNAKCLIFLPLFDHTQQQWYAGGFVWSNDPDIHGLETLIPYLKAFGSCIMSEVTGMETINTNTARTTFIASISHDLRSPLHGMLGNLEFLEDTLTSAYQVSLVGSIETCGKTLLDTIDHLLDHAKINNLNRAEAKNGSRQSLQTEKMGTPSLLTNSDLSSSRIPTLDLALLVEEVTEAAFAGQTFRKKNLRGQDAIDDAAHTIQGLTIDDCQSVEDTIHQGSAKFSGRVFFILDIQHADSWLVKSESPGALRRIILNIIGNAIKYCNSGLIEVKLCKPEIDSNHAEVTMSIKDTGIGMSQAFLENHLFKAFSQEDSFSPGAGLGLSIARQLVDELHGNISVRSEKGVGTHVDVSMPMQFADPVERADQDILHIATRVTKGKKICLLNPDSDGAAVSEGQVSKLAASIADMCRSWFDLEFCESATIDAEPDSDIFVYAEPPPIEYLTQHHSERKRAGKHGGETALLIICTNAFEAAALRTAGVSDLTSLGRIIEVISQPVGIRKLAKVLLSSLQRVQATIENGSSGIPKEAVAHLETNQGSNDIKWSSSPVVYDPISKRLRPSIEALKWKSEQPQIKAGLLPEVVPAVPNITEQASGETRMAHVLVVDDNPINLRLLVTFMKKIKLPYAEAVNGLEAYNKFKESDTPFDFVLMDLQMPVMDGLESTRKIREHEQQVGSANPTTVIAITGVGSESVRSDCMDSGMNQFLTKPVKFKTLQQLLERHNTT